MEQTTASAAALLEPLRLITHDCVRIESKTGTVVYIDPYETDGASREADVILITHDHFDHFSPDDIRNVARPDAVVIVPASLAGQAAALGLGRVITMRSGDAVQPADGIDVMAVPAYNIAKDFHPACNGWLGYVVSVDGIRYFHMGDTDRTPDNDSVACDVLLIPVGGTYTMDAEEAARCALCINPRIAVPMHYGSVAGERADGERFAQRLAALQNGRPAPIPSAVIMER